MKDQIRSAQIVLPCANLDRTLAFFTERLGFRLEMIYPADAPRVAVISGYGLTLRLETSSEQVPVVLRLAGDFSSFSGDTEREIHSPDGVRIIFADAESQILIPEGTQEFIVSVFGNENSWVHGRAGMQYRDLIPGRLGDRFVASHIHIPEGGEIPDYVHYHKVRFQMIYCISGWARLVYEHQGEPFLMNAGDCVLQPPEIRHRVLESSAAFEVLEIGCPAIHETYADHALDLPNETGADEKLYDKQRFLHHVAAQAVWRDGQIEGIQLRDTEIAEASGGLGDVRILRAEKEANFSVKHAGEFLFFFILKGNLRLRAAQEGADYRLNANDCFVLPRGAEYLVSLDKGLEMLRISIPANEY